MKLIRISSWRCLIISFQRPLHYILAEKCCCFSYGGFLYGNSNHSPWWNWCFDVNQTKSVYNFLLFVVTFNIVITRITPLTTPKIRRMTDTTSRRISRSFLEKFCFVSHDVINSIRNVANGNSDSSVVSFFHAEAKVTDDIQREMTVVDSRIQSTIEWKQHRWRIKTERLDVPR